MINSLQGCYSVSPLTEKIRTPWKKKKKGGWYSLLSSCIFLLSLKLIMTRLLFDAGETVFHFLLTSNSRYLILPGNAKLWGCYPNCSSEFSASGEQSKYEKQSMWNYFLLVVFRFGSCFLNAWQLGLMLTSRCERDSKPLPRCEENSEWGGPSALCCD